MRARNIKPGFFKNESLAELDPVARLLFIGLWCYADREGRFEWRPKKIKAEIFPYDDIDITSTLQAVTKDGFVIKYAIDGTEYGQIVNFKKHQNPHPHETPSVIPEYNQCQGDYVTSREMSLTCRADSLIPDSLIPDSKEVGSGEPASLPTKEDISESAIPKVMQDIENVTGKLYEEKIFPKVWAFKNAMLKNKVNPRTILHALIRCYLRKPSANDAWGYCLEIVKVEDGNYNERESGKAL